MFADAGRLSLYGRGAERLHEELAPVTARWIEPSGRSAPLQAYARAAEARTLERWSGRSAAADQSRARSSGASCLTPRPATSRSCCPSSKREPERVRAFYEVQATRVEPVGLVYLWPETN